MRRSRPHTRLMNPASIAVSTFLVAGLSAALAPSVYAEGDMYKEGWQCTDPFTDTNTGKEAKAYDVRVKSVYCLHREDHPGDYVKADVIIKKCEALTPSFVLGPAYPPQLVWSDQLCQLVRDGSVTVTTPRPNKETNTATYPEGKLEWGFSKTGNKMFHCSAGKWILEQKLVVAVLARKGAMSRDGDIWRDVPINRKATLDIQACRGSNNPV